MGDPYGTPATGFEWASGGGDSIFFAKPSYQTLLNTGSTVRAVPDIALHMGGCPVGSVLPCATQRSADIVAIGGGLYGVIGTSASSPDMAGLLALEIQRTKGRLGNENTNIYTLASLQSTGKVKTPYFRNHIAGYNNQYSAGGSYSRVIGVGSVIANTFLRETNAPLALTPQSSSNP